MKYARKSYMFIMKKEAGLSGAIFASSPMNVHLALNTNCTRYKNDTYNYPIVLELILETNNMCSFQFEEQYWA